MVAPEQHTDLDRGSDVNLWPVETRYGYGMTRAPQPASITAEELVGLIAERDAMLAERDALRGELRVTKVERDLLKEQLKAYVRRLFGAKSEARSADQRDLFLNEAEALAPTAATLPAQEEDEAETQVAGHAHKKPGRKPLDPALPREVVRYELPESERVCRHDGSVLAQRSASLCRIKRRIRALRLIDFSWRCLRR